MPSAPNFLSREREELGESQRRHRSALRTFNIEKPTSRTDHQAKNESDDGSRHKTALLRTRNNRNRNPIGGADAKYENAIG